MHHPVPRFQTEKPEPLPASGGIFQAPLPEGRGVQRWALAIFAATLGCGAVLARAATPPDLSPAIRVIRAVGPEGRGNVEASVAWKQLATADPAAVVLILKGMDDANELALNWLRAAVEVIADRELAASGKLSSEGLVEFLSDTSHHPGARRLAFELIRRQDPARADSLLAGMINDPSLELRRDAVQQVVDTGKAVQDSGDRAKAVSTYRQALGCARDLDQIESISKRLGELGQTVDLAAVFGWVSRWRVIGPFDSTAGKGFEVVYPPEVSFDALAEYDGKTGKTKWRELMATNELGTVDFNRPLGKLKGVAGYARAEIFSDTARPVEVRLGTENAWKVWLNGDLLFAREEYHRAAAIDQYRLPATLKPGANVILIKLCQNEQTEDWADGWEFQLRVTDKLGTPIVSSQRSAVAPVSVRQEKGATQ